MLGLPFLIKTHTEFFNKKFILIGSTTDSALYRHTSRYDTAYVSIYRTSTKCYRLISYYSHLSVTNKSYYYSFRSLADLCAYLDSTDNLLS